MQTQEDIEFYDSARKSEKAYIGAILLNNELMNHAVEQVNSKAFIIGKNRPIFSAMIELHKKHLAISPTTIMDEMRSHGDEIDQDYEAYINSLVNDVPFALTKDKPDHFTRFALITAFTSMNEALFSDMQMTDIGKAVAEKFRFLRQLPGLGKAVGDLQEEFQKVSKVGGNSKFGPSCCNASLIVRFSSIS